VHAVNHRIISHIFPRVNGIFFLAYCHKEDYTFLNLFIKFLYNNSLVNCFKNNFMLFAEYNNAIPGSSANSDVNARPEVPQPNTPEIRPDTPNRPNVPHNPEITPERDPMPGKQPNEVPQPGRQNFVTG
jgi:hypothetical protein